MNPTSPFGRTKWNMAQIVLGRSKMQKIGYNQ